MLWELPWQTLWWLMRLPISGIGFLGLAGIRGLGMVLDLRGKLGRQMLNIQVMIQLFHLVKDGNGEVLLIKDLGINRKREKLYILT